jgi:hypothetical protein
VAGGLKLMAIPKTYPSPKNVFNSEFSHFYPNPLKKCNFGYHSGTVQNNRNTTFLFHVSSIFQCEFAFVEYISWIKVKMFNIVKL